MKIRGWLEELEGEERWINVGLIGAGMVGRLMTSQVSLMKGMKVSVIAELKIDRAVEAFRVAGIPSNNIMVLNDIDAINNAVMNGKFVVTTNAEIVTKVSPIDVIVEATGDPETGARIAFEAINNRKHVVMVNKEADVTVGHILKRFADNAGVVYTGSAGDEPGAIMELYDFINALGLEIVAVGKGKNNPLNRWVTPDDLAKDAVDKGLSLKILTYFVDGTNTMVEMAQISNATGLIPDVRGMHGPRATLADIPNIFRLKEKGGILQNLGVVDYVIGVAPGVFLVATMESEEVKKGLKYLGLGEGPNYLFFRPYHMPGIETPLSIAYAVLYGEPTIAPLGEPKAEVMTVAKKDLEKGQRFDFMGGHTTYGTIEKLDVAREEDALPIGLSEGALLKKNVPKNEIITYDMVELDEEKFIVHLRMLQDKIFR